MLAQLELNDSSLGLTQNFQMLSFELDHSQYLNVSLLNFYPQYNEDVQFSLSSVFGDTICI